MVDRRKLAAVLATSVCLTAGVAYAAEQSTSSTSSQPTPSQQAALTKDVGKLSADSSKAYIDVALTRLAIFDGKIDQAKKFINEADSSFDKAKSDESVFVKAEADMKTPNQMKAMNGKDGAKTADDTTSANAGDGAATNMGEAKNTDDAKTPKRWLPVDATMTVAEDYSANAQKAAAVGEANKKLAKGDKKGAIDTLKLADVNLEYVMAVVPLDQTLTDVHEAATDVNDGKFYEASQVLRQLQAGTRYDLIDVNGVPTKASSTSAKPAAPAH